MGEFNVRGPELKKLLKLARKQPVSFAYSPGNSPKEDYFGLDKRKPPKTVFKKAQEEGPSKKVSFGTVQVDGKLLCVTCERELPAMAKRLKKYLKLEKITLNVQILGPDGALLEEDVEELPEDADDLALADGPDAAATEGRDAGEPPVEAKPPLERLAEEHAALMPLIGRALAGAEAAAKQVARLNDKVLSSLEQKKEGMAIQFMAMLNAELAKLPPDDSAPRETQTPDRTDTADPAPQEAAPPQEAASPMAALADAFAALAPAITRARAGEAALAKQVDRMAEKVRDSIERGKEGMAKQFMDMLQAELKKAPQSDAADAADAEETPPVQAQIEAQSLSEAPASFAAQPAEPVSESVSGSEEKSPIDQMSDTFRKMSDWIEAASASDEKVAAQIARLSDKLRDSLERGKEGMARQFMDMLQAELNKTPQPQVTAVQDQPAAPVAEAAPLSTGDPGATSQLASAPMDQPAPVSDAAGDGPVAPATGDDAAAGDTTGAATEAAASEAAKAQEAAKQKAEVEAQMTKLFSQWRKSPHNFAWLYASGQTVLQAHRKKSHTAMIKLALKSGAKVKGAWGSMQLYGNTLELYCRNEPPSGFARLARSEMLRLANKKIGIVVITPSGEREIGEEEEVEIVPTDTEFDPVAHKIHLAYMESFNSPPEEIARFDAWIAKNYMAEADGDEKGGEILAKALAGKSELGPLDDVTKSYLVGRTAQRWIFSPANHEDGAKENIEDLVKAVEDDPKMKALVGQSMLRAYASIGDLYLSAKSEGDDKTRTLREIYDILEKERAVQYEMREALIDLVPEQYLSTFKSKKGGERLARMALGHVKRTPLPGMRGQYVNPDAKGGFYPPLEPEYQQKIMKSVAAGNLPKEQRDEYYKVMFEGSWGVAVWAKDSMWGTVFDADESTPGSRDAYAAMLTANQIDRHNLSPEAAENLKTTMLDAMKSDGAREVLFSASFDANARQWALDQMTPPSQPKVHFSFGKPDEGEDQPQVPPTNAKPHKPWKVSDLENGWESDVVATAFGERTFQKLKKENGYQAMSMDGLSTGTRAHMAAQVLGIGARANALKGLSREKIESMTKDELVLRKHPADEAPMETILEHIGPQDTPSGKVEPVVTPIPISLVNREFGPMVYHVLRVEAPGAKEPLKFIDHKGGRYFSVETNEDPSPHWIENEVIPAGKMTYPEGLVLGAKLKTAASENDSLTSRLMSEADKAAQIAAAAAAVAVIVGSGGTAAPVVAGIAGGYTMIRSGQKLLDMHELGYDATDISDPAVRGLMLDIVSGATGLGALGGSMRIAKATANAEKLSRTTSTLLATMNVADNVVDAAGLVNAVATLQQNWNKLSEDEKASALLSLAYQMTMKARAMHGSGFKGEFSIKQARNMIEHGAPFEMETLAPGAHIDPTDPSVKIAVRHTKKGDFTIVTAADANIPKPIMDLHVKAATAMQTSMGLKARIKRMIGADKKAPPPSPAWEAGHEINKIQGEVDLIREKLNSGTLTDKQIAALKRRELDLDLALVREARRLSDWEGDPKGFVASPGDGEFSKGYTQAQALRWPINEGDLPDGYHWVHSKDGNPYIASETGPRLHYDPYAREFVTEEKLLSQAEKNFDVEAEVERAFVPYEDGREFNPKADALNPDEVMVRKKQRMADPFASRQRMYERNEEIAKILDIKPEKIKPLAKFLGSDLGDEFAGPWAIAVKKSKGAAKKLKKIEQYTREGKFEEAKKLKDDVYGPVQKKFWREIYKSKKIREARGKGLTKEIGEFEDLVAKIEATGMTFDGPKAPYIPMRDPSNPEIILKDKKGNDRAHRLSLEHIERKSDVPLLAQDVGNLRFALDYENSQILEAIRLVQEKHLRRPDGTEKDWAHGRR